MTRKHFIALADFIKTQNQFAAIMNAVAFHETQIFLLADFLDSYPHFKRSQWLAYIKGENSPSGGKVK